MVIGANRLLLALAIAAIGILSYSAGYTSATTKSPTPAIIDVTIKALTETKLTAIEDIPYWKIIGGRGARAAGVSAYVSSDKKFDVGVSRYEPVTLQLHNWPIDEFMYIVEGNVEITDDSGHSRTYGPGDAFLMPKGFEGTWKQHSEIKKINVAYDPAK